MHGSRKRRLQQELPRAQALGALAALTAGIGQGVLVIGDETVALDDIVGLKIGLKYVGDTCVLKVSLKYPAAGSRAPSPDGWTSPVPGPAREAGEAVETGGKPRYKGLKKRMKPTFNAIRAALAAGQAPDPGTVAAFVADSRLMTSYSGKGDDAYPAYNAEVDRLEAAAAAGDLDALASAVAALGRMKKECHSRHA